MTTAAATLAQLAGAIADNTPRAGENCRQWLARALPEAFEACNLHMIERGSGSRMAMVRIELYEGALQQRNEAQDALALANLRAGIAEAMVAHCEPVGVRDLLEDISTAAEPTTDDSFSDFGDDVAQQINAARGG
jgi:hypothetical protein